MNFQNKYLKYSPKITFDIFKRVFDKLIESGFSEYSDKKVEMSYAQFCGEYNYLTAQGSKTFNTHKCPYYANFSETTVQEILGYDPFVKDDDFVLPEKWCCKISEESIDVFNNWRISMSKHYLQNKINKKYPYITNNGSCNYTTMGIEITFDQFKKYVLKQNVEEGKEVIPEYVECISWFGNSFTPSKIYKVVNGKVKNNDGDHDITNWNHGRFKPSSKSAFDAQNQSKQLSEQTANNISETIDRVRYRTMQTNQSDMLENALKSLTCEIQHYDHEFIAQMIGGKVSKVNKVQISTDNEIKINIIQKQSIKI